MRAITGTLQKDAWDRHVLPPVEEVRSGLWSIPVPIPINPLRYVLVYALELRDGIALVDTGWDTDDAWEALGSGLATFGATVTDVKAVVVTHIHPDHYGLAGRVRAASGAWVALHPADAALLRERYEDVDGLVASMRDLLAASGVPADLLPDLSEASMQIRAFVSMAPPDVLLEDGETLDLRGWDFTTIWTPGHSPGHVCLYSEASKILLSGDHVLPRITPNIGFHSQQVPNPLGDYLESLARLKSFDVAEVLPGHEYRFADLRVRLRELEQHHDERLAEILRSLRARPGATAWELTTSLSWQRRWEEIPAYMQRAANGEVLAHLALLERRGRVRRGAGLPFRFYVDDDAVGVGDEDGGIDEDAGRTRRGRP